MQWHFSYTFLKAEQDKMMVQPFRVLTKSVAHFFTVSSKNCKQQTHNQCDCYLVHWLRMQSDKVSFWYSISLSHCSDETSQYCVKSVLDQTPNNDTTISFSNCYFYKSPTFCLLYSHINNGLSLLFQDLVTHAYDSRTLSLASRSCSKPTRNSCLYRISH